MEEIIMEKEAEDKRLVDEANKVLKKRLFNREEVFLLF